MRGRRVSHVVAGFSLVEVGAAIFIIGVIAVGILGVVMSGQSAQARSTARTAALEIAQRTLNDATAPGIANVALAQSQVTGLSTSETASWQAERGTGTPLTRDTGRVAPFTTSGNYLVAANVWCTTNDADCRDDDGNELPRNVRVTVVHERLGARVSLTSQVDGSEAAPVSGPVGAAPDAPADVVASQVTDNSVWIRWNRPAGATGYDITRNGAALGTSIYPGFSDTPEAPPSGPGLPAARTLEYCVSALGPNQSASAPACVTVLTRVSDLNVTGGAGATTLSWSPANPGAGAGVFQVERRRGNANWVQIGASSATTPFNDSGSQCGDLYRVRVYKDGVTPGGAASEGVEVATSRSVSAC